MIKVESVEKSFGSLRVLRGVDLRIARGEVVAITGASGAGKTTLLQIIGTLMSPDKGVVELADQRVDKMGDRELSRFRNQNIGFVFQFHNLLAEFSAFENICLPAYIGSGITPEVEARAEELLAMMGLAERRNHKPNELSGGEQQRVAIARALINSPAIILADEPSGNLDSLNRAEIHKLFFELRDRFALTVVVVTHDEALAAMSDRVIVMRDGEIISQNNG
ncbi:MAG: ABC transporter ATP-binding protein [Rikenellaceae bacterium]